MPSARTRQGRNRGVYHSLGGRPQGLGFDSKPSFQRVAVPLSRGSGARDSATGDRAAGEETAAFAGGAFSRGGPAGTYIQDRDTGRMIKCHLDEKALQRATRNAVKASDVTKRATAHTLRHSFTTRLLQRGADFRTFQNLLDQNDVSTAMIYTHLIQEGRMGKRSPLDML